MVRGVARSRLALGGAIAVVLVLGLVGLLVVRDGDGEANLVSGGLEPSTTLAGTTTTPPPVTVAASPTLAAPSTTTPRPATTARSVPTMPVTTVPAGEQLTTTAGAHGQVQTALRQARQRWQAARPARGYVWSYENDCRCSPRRVEVTVDGAGAVTAVRELDGPPSPQPVAAGLSVDGAFDALQSAIDANAAKISVRFDPSLGLPSSYFIDRSTRLADEETGLTVLTFTPRS